MLSTLRGLRTRARARASEDGWVPLSEQGADWPRAAGRAVPSLLQVALPAVALFLAGATAGYLAFPTYLGPVVLSVSPNPLFAADLSYLKARPYDPLPADLVHQRNLNYQQCDDAFPLLWPAVHEAAEQFSRGITLDELDRLERDETRVSVVDGQLYVKTFHGEWTSRSFAVLASLNEAVRTSPDAFPDVEFVFRATDNLENGAHFGLTKRDSDRMFLLPDFGFYSWPEPRVLGWQDARRKAIEFDARLNWTSKEDKLFWRGAYLSQLRHDLRDVANAHPWGDIGEIKWGEGATGWISMEQHCGKRFLADADSHSYSGRLKYLMLCRSVVVSHRKQWRQSWHGALDGRPGSPTQNFIELGAESWDGLVEAVDHLRVRPSHAEAIAENAVRALRDRYLTPASVTCYWRRVLAEYAVLQRFVPTRGGIDFESFILAREVDYAPH